MPTAATALRKSVSRSARFSPAIEGSSARPAAKLQPGDGTHEWRHRRRPAFSGQFRSRSIKGCDHGDRAATRKTAARSQRRNGARAPRRRRNRPGRARPQAAQGPNRRTYAPAPAKKESAATRKTREDSVIASADRQAARVRQRAARANVPRRLRRFLPAYGADRRARTCSTSSSTAASMRATSRACPTAWRT